MPSTPACENNELSAVDAEDVLLALNDLLPTIDLEVTSRRTAQQMLADHFGVAWDNINVHGEAIRQAVLAYCDKNLDLDGPGSQEPSEETIDVRNEALSKSESDEDLSESDNDKEWLMLSQASSEDEEDDTMANIGGSSTILERERHVQLIGFERASLLNGSLSRFVDAKVMSRVNLMRFIHGYVKEHDLHDVQDRKIIKYDKHLRDALN